MNCLQIQDSAQIILMKEAETVQIHIEIEDM